MIPARLHNQGGNLRTVIKGLVVAGGLATMLAMPVEAGASTGVRVLRQAVEVHGLEDLQLAGG